MTKRTKNLSAFLPAKLWWSFGLWPVSYSGGFRFKSYLEVAKIWCFLLDTICIIQNNIGQHGKIKIIQLDSGLFAHSTSESGVGVFFSCGSVLGFEASKKPFFG